MAWAAANPDPVIVAPIRINAVAEDESWSQSTEASTRVSELFGDIDPLVWLNLSQVTLDVMLNVNGFGPPAPMSMYLLWMGAYRSRCMV